MNSEGKMFALWINLYGTKPNERPGWFGESTMEHYLEGSDYLGRVLISMFVTPAENPKMSKLVAMAPNEPMTANYVFKFQVFELSQIS